MMQFNRRYLVLLLGLVNLAVQILRYYDRILRYPSTDLPAYLPIYFSLFVMSYGLPFLSAYYVVSNEYVKGGLGAILCGILWGVPFLMNPAFYLDYLFILEYLGKTVNWVIFGLVGMITLYCASKLNHLLYLHKIILVGALLIPTMIVSLDQILLWNAPRMITIL